MASIAVARRNLSWAEARSVVLSSVRVLEPETIALVDARGRALRATLRAPHDLPPFANSSMDGYAVRATDLAAATATSPVELPVVGVVAAGAAGARPLGAHEAMRIMTGAELPPGADAIVPFEETEAPGPDAVRFTRAVAPGANRREAGTDLRAGELVLEAGRELSPYDLALLGALGIARVPVGPRPTAAILSTGDELLEIDQPLKPGAIRDSNSTMLRLLLEEAGCVVTRTERLHDDPDHVLARMRNAIASADVTFTIGGVSMGDYDPVKQSLGSLGGIEWWRVAMKPGQPQAFGAPDGRLYFGLPGNPASVACVFEALARPALRAMQGFASLDRPRLRVKSAVEIESRAGRVDFVRIVLAMRDGDWWATPAGPQVSGHLTPQSRAHALLVVPETVTVLAPGEAAEAWLLRWPEDTGSSRREPPELC